MILKNAGSRAWVYDHLSEEKYGKHVCGTEIIFL